MRKSVLYLFWGGLLGALLGVLITVLVFAVVSLREAVYSWLGYYMTYFPAFVIIGGGLLGVAAAKALQGQ